MRVYCIGADGAPLPGVEAHAVLDRADQWCELQQGLGFSDPAGALMLPRLGAGRFYLFQHPDHQAETRVALREDDVVQFQAGAEVALDVVDAIGRPVADAEVTLSTVRLAADPGRVPQGLALVAAGSRPVAFSRHSDGRGEVRIPGLPMGRYLLRVLHPTLVPVAGLPDDMLAVAAGGTSRLRVVMARLHAAMLQVVGDELVSYLHRRPRPSCRSAAVLDYTRPLEDRLQRRWPGALVSIVAADPDDASGRLPLLQLRLLLARSGWRQIEVPMLELSADMQPTMFDFAAAEPDPNQCAFGLEVIGADGAHLAGAAATISNDAVGRFETARQRDANDLPVMIRVRSGSVVRLPAGSYSLRFADPVLAGLVGPERCRVTLPAGGEVRHRIELPVRLVETSVRILGPGGMPCPEGQLRIVAVGAQGAWTIPWRTLAPVDLMVPPGRYRIEARADGCVAAQLEVDLELPSSQSWEIRLRPVDG